MLHWMKVMLSQGPGGNISGHSLSATATRCFRSSMQGRAIHRAVSALVAAFGPVEERESKREISFRRRRGFAFLWRPGHYLGSEMPAVLTIALPRRVSSPRFRLVAHPLASVWMHHLEIPEARTIDSEVASWLREAYDAAQ